MSISYLVGRFASGLAPGTVPAPAPVNGYIILRYSHLLQVNTAPGTLIPVTPVRLPIVDGVLVGPDGVPSTTSPIPVQATDDPQLAQTGDGVFGQIDIVFDGGSEPVQAMLALPAGTVVDIATASRAGTGGAVFVSGLTPSQLDELGEGLAATEAARDAALVTLSQAQAAAAAAEEAAEGAAAPTDATIATLLATPGSATRSAMDAIESRPGYDIVLAIGQSNMVGRGFGADLVNLDPAVGGRVYEFGATGRYANQIVNAIDPLAHWDSNGNVGPGMSFARTYIASRPVHRKVLIVSAAQGATAFSDGAKRWRTTWTPLHQNLYELAIRQAQMALAAAGPGSRIVGFIWHQGEGDGSAAGAYAGELDALITGLRSRLEVPGAWFVIGQMSVPGTAISAGKQQVQAAQIDTPRRQPLTAFAYGPAAGHNPDDTTHLSAAGQRVLGESMAQAVALARANVPGTVPVPPASLSSIQSPPGTLVVRIERPLCRFLDWVVEYRAVGTTPWIAWAHTASAHRDARINGLVAGQAYEVRAATVNEQGTSAWSPVTTLRAARSVATTASVAPVRAYSTRKIRSDYTGNCLRVRRGSDSAVLEVGFTPDGLIDEAAIRTFVGVSGDGFVSAWYDQMGAGGMSAPNVADQPQIVKAGDILKDNGRVVLSFDGAGNHMRSSLAILATSAAGFTAIMALRDTGSTGTPRILSEGNTASDTAMLTWYYNASSGTMGTQRRGDDNVIATASDASSLSVVSGRMQVLTLTDDTAAVKFGIDRSEGDPAARPRTGSAFTLNRLTLGGFLRSTLTETAKMRLSEVLLWNTALSDADRRAVLADVREFHDL